MLDSATARRNGFKVGDTVKVLDRADTPHSFTVSGLMDFGVDQEIGYRGAVGFNPQAATSITGRSGFVEIDLKAAPGVGQAQLRSAVAAAAGGSYDVVTSHELAKRLSASSGVSPDQMGLFFLAFAIVALFVSALVIYNTFNILIAQRMREMALLRCVGATRAQVFRGVLTESVIVGFVASALGVVFGVGLGTGGAALFASANNASLGPVTVSPTPIIVGMLAGHVRHGPLGPAARPRRHARPAGRRAPQPGGGPGQGPRRRRPAGHRRADRCRRARGRRSGPAVTDRAGRVPARDGRRDR